MQNLKLPLKCSAGKVAREWFAVARDLAAQYHLLLGRPLRTNPTLLEEHEFEEPEHTHGLEPIYRRSVHTGHEVDGKRAVWIACRRSKSACELDACHLGLQQRLEGSTGRAGPEFFLGPRAKPISGAL